MSGHLLSRSAALALTWQRTRLAAVSFVVTISQERYGQEGQCSMALLLPKGLSDSY